MSEINSILDLIALLIFEQKAISKYSSDDMIRNVLEAIENNKSKNTLNSVSLTNKLIEYSRDLLDRKADGDKLSPSVISRYVTLEMMGHQDELSLYDESSLSEMVRSTLTPPKDIEELEDTIRTLKKRVFKYFSNLKLSSMTYMINSGLRRGSIDDILTKVRQQVEELEKNNVVKDEAIFTELLFNKQELEENADDIFNRIKERTFYKTGYTLVNEGTGGGVTSGEAVVVNSRSNNNKSGVLIGLTAGIGVLNKFKPKKKKMPLILHISYEDNEVIVLPRYYDSLRTALGDPKPEHEPTLKEMAFYVEQCFKKSGATFMFVHVDPSQWGYRNMFSYTENLESKGYYLVSVTIDYLDKLSSAGLNKGGPIGADKRELLRRTRNFYGKKQTTMITAWQMNPAINTMLANDMDPLDIPKYAAGKSFYQGSTALINEIDLEIIIALGKRDGRTYQAMQIGKQRGDKVVSEELKHGYYQFPTIGNIPLDAIMGKKMYKRKVEDFNSSGIDSDSIF